MCRTRRTTLPMLSSSGLAAIRRHPTVWAPQTIGSRDQNSGVRHKRGLCARARERERERESERDPQPQWDVVELTRTPVRRAWRSFAGLPESRTLEKEKGGRERKKGGEEEDKHAASGVVESFRVAYQPGQDHLEMACLMISAVRLAVSREPSTCETSRGRGTQWGSGVRPTRRTTARENASRRKRAASAASLLGPPPPGCGGGLSKATLALPVSS